jgi:hypothetical protein
MFSLYVLNYQVVHLHSHVLLRWAVTTIHQGFMPWLSSSRLEMLDVMTYQAWVVQLPHLTGTRIDSLDLTLASQQVNMVPSRTMNAIGRTNQSIGK